MANVVLSISVLEDRVAVCRFDPQEDIPGWVLGCPFYSITRSADELSVICNEENVPEGVRCARDWRVLKLDGPLDLALIGVLASVLDPLAAEGISILSVGTYDTDYIMVKTGQYERAIAVLAAAGHRIKRV